MADLSKKQLSERALALGVQLSAEVKTDGLNHAQLTALVADLESQVKEKARAAVVLDGTEKLPEGYTRPSVDEFVAKGYRAENYENYFAEYEHGLLVDAALAKQADAQSSSIARAADAQGQPSDRRYVLAQNKSIHCLRGVLGEGEEVFAADIMHNGAERLAQLDAEGHFVK